jgi:hypothetical protein
MVSAESEYVELSEEVGNLKEGMEKLTAMMATIMAA